MQEGAFLLAAMPVSATEFVCTVCTDPIIVISRGDQRHTAAELLCMPADYFASILHADAPPGAPHAPPQLQQGGPQAGAAPAGAGAALAAAARTGVAADAGAAPPGAAAQVAHAGPDAAQQAAEAAAAAAPGSLSAGTPSSGVASSGDLGQRLRTPSLPTSSELSYGGS